MGSNKLEQFPKSDQVTFRFLRGRLALFNEDFTTVRVLSISFVRFATAAVPAVGVKVRVCIARC